MRSVKSGLAMLSVAVIATFYVFAYMDWVGGHSIDTSVISMGSIEYSVKAVGVVVRDELVMESDRSGLVLPVIEEGGKAAKGSLMAQMVKEGLYRDALRLAEVERKIGDLTMQGQTARPNGYGDVRRIDEEVDSKVRRLAYAMGAGRPADVMALKGEVDRLLERRWILTGGDGVGDGYLAELREERAGLMAKVGPSAVSLYAPSSGTVSYAVDGYEAILTLGSAPSMTPGEIEGVIEDLGSFKGAYYMDGETRPVAKVVLGMDYALCLIVDGQTARAIGSRGTVTVRVAEAPLPIACEVLSAQAHDDGRYVLCLRSDRYMQHMAGVRSLEAELVIEKHEGLMVPLESLARIDESFLTATIALVKDGEVRDVHVRIVAYDDQSAILENIDNPNGRKVFANDRYVTRPVNVVDGQSVT
ncbi:MAG: hypothetical protein FWE70_04680 [Oscillospiraceae bacterium]|nr:hypothetical protein [Oscillospiraceae bacterium]